MIRAYSLGRQASVVGKFPGLRILDILVNATLRRSLVGNEKMSEEERSAHERFIERLTWKEGDVEIIYDPLANKNSNKERTSSRRTPGREDGREPKTKKKDSK